MNLSRLSLFCTELWGNEVGTEQHCHSFSFHSPATLSWWLRTYIRTIFLVADVRRLSVFLINPTHCSLQKDSMYGIDSSRFLLILQYLTCKLQIQCFLGLKPSVLIRSGKGEIETSLAASIMTVNKREKQERGSIVLVRGNLQRAGCCQSDSSRLATAAPDRSHRQTEQEAWGGLAKKNQIIWL